MKTLPPIGARVLCCSGWQTGKKAIVKSAQLEDWGRGSQPYGNLTLTDSVAGELIGENLSEWEVIGN